MSDLVIQRVDGDGLAAALAGLSRLLEACVEDGASIGFLWPMAAGEAEGYWRSLVASVEAGETVLLVATDAERVVGTGQLVLATKANGVHRAEVSKLMVMPDARKRGLGRAIMLALEEQARAHNRTTLVLDTCQDGGAEPLYRSLGWVEVGPVPAYAAWPDGSLGATVIYYKLLDAP